MSDFDSVCPRCGTPVKLRAEYSCPPFGVTRRFEYHRISTGCALDRVFIDPEAEPRAARPFGIVRNGVLTVVEAEAGARR